MNTTSEIIENYNGCKCNGGGGGGRETVTWILDNVMATVAYSSSYDDYCIAVPLPETITEDNYNSTFLGKNTCTIVEGKKVTAPVTAPYDDAEVAYYYPKNDAINTIDMKSYDLSFVVYYTEADNGKSVAVSLGIVDDLV